MQKLVLAIPCLFDEAYEIHATLRAAFKYESAAQLWFGLASSDSNDVLKNAQEYGTFVCRGILSVGATPTGPGPKFEPVICKMALNSSTTKKLKSEAQLYAENLFDLQGKGIPYFYGFFSEPATGDDSPSKISCILLSDCGIRMGPQESFRTYPKNLRVKILMILLNIHRAGVKHTDLKVRNIVLSRGSEKEPTIIDFNNASGHNCQFNGDIEDLEIGGWRPYFAIVECREIYYTCRAMDLWVPTETEHEGCTVPTECLSSAQELLGYMERYHGMSANLQENIRSAERCVATFHIMYRNELRALGFLKT